MTYTLRPYQARAVAHVMDHIRTSIEPCIIDAATGAGKSMMIADIARQVYDMSGGKSVLCLAPQAELVEQNREKYLMTGEPASIFSASAGGKSLRHPVVFGTPSTVKNSISRFGSKFAAIIIDECHGITKTIKTIIEYMRELNPNIRVIGFTATPYRLGEGYIYRVGPNDKPVPDFASKDPYFAKCVDRITAHELIAQGYLTPPLIGAGDAESYDTSNLDLRKPSTIDEAFVGHGRLTSQIVADVVAQSRNRMGVMFFAATIQHADEIMASLPPGLSAIVTGKTSKGDRRSILEQFKARKIKYLVNVSVLTTGFDAAHVDVIALLRRTDSVGLMQQIIGRGLRLHDDKKNCLVLDYAGNIEEHCPDGDLFNPEIKAHKGKGEGGSIHCECPMCGGENEFGARQNPEGYNVTPDGYFADLTGAKIETDHGPLPAHFGRRCLNLVPIGGGKLDQCQYRWTSKECPHCEEPNDIAARYCFKCKGEIIDPNEKLALEFRALKRNPRERQCDEVTGWLVKDTVSQRGNEMKRYDVVTPYRSFSVWVMQEPTNNLAASTKALFDSLQGGQPETITYKKDDAGFFKVFAFNEPKDKEPSTT